MTSRPFLDGHCVPVLVGKGSLDRGTAIHALSVAAVVIQR
jgi:hypothetical protein